METLSAVICGADKRAMQKIAQALSDDGVSVETLNPINLLISKTNGGDFFLIDLDGLNPYVLCSLLSIVRYTFPHTPVIGISAKSKEKLLSDDFKLDACFKQVPHLDELVVSAPSLAARCHYEGQSPNYN